MPPSGKFGLGQQKPEHFLGAKEDSFSQTVKFSVKAGIGSHYFSESLFRVAKAPQKQSHMASADDAIYLSSPWQTKEPRPQNMLSSNCVAASLQPPLDRKLVQGKCCTTEIHLREKGGLKGRPAVCNGTAVLAVHQDHVLG